MIKIPKGVYPRTEYHRLINSNAHKKENLSEETLQKLRYKRTEYHREINRIGHLGIKLSPEARMKMSLARKGKRHDASWCKKISLALKGKRRSMASIDKQRRAICGSYIQRFGYEKADMIRKKQSAARRGKSFMSLEGKQKLSNLHKGEKNIFWNGGASFVRYGQEFNKSLKKKVKELFGKTCFLCSATHKLAIHHIDYNKRNNSITNLVPLCFAHHVVTNKNRAYWTGFFQTHIALYFFNKEGG